MKYTNLLDKAYATGEIGLGLDIGSVCPLPVLEYPRQLSKVFREASRRSTGYPPLKEHRENPTSPFSNKGNRNEPLPSTSKSLFSTKLRRIVVSWQLRIPLLALSTLCAEQTQQFQFLHTASSFPQR